MNDYRSVIQIQQKINSLEETSLTATFMILSKSSMYLSEELQIQLLHTILFSCFSKPERNTLYALLCSMILQENKSLIPPFLDLFFDNSYNDRECLLKIPLLHLLRSIMLKGIVIPSQIIEKIVQYYENNTFHRYTTRLFVAVWGREIEEFNPQFFQKIMEEVMCSEFTTDHFLSPESSIKDPSFIIRKWFQTIQRLGAHRWEIADQMFLYGGAPDSIEAIIKRDDVDALSGLILDSAVLVDDIIEGSIYEPSIFLKNSPSLIQYAAYTGALKCFKFLMLKEADLDYEDYAGNRLPQYAVAGGDLEIIRICEQSEMSLAQTAPIAALNRHQSVLEWLVDVCNIDIHEKSPNGMTIASAAAEANNLEALAYIADKGFDFSLEDAPSPLFVAVKRRAIESIGFLLTQKTTRIDWPIINLAIETNNRRIISLFLRYNNLTEEQRKKLNDSISILDLI